jgi:hypothetical protein
MCDTMREERLVSADKIKMRVAGRRCRTHAAKTPTTDDFPECRNAFSNPRRGGFSMTSAKNAIISL